MVNVTQTVTQTVTGAIVTVVMMDVEALAESACRMRNAMIVDVAGIASQTVEA